MANLSNINGKFLFTDGDFLLIGGATANSISATESGVAIKNSNAATLSLQNSATNGKNHTLWSNTDGSFNITDVGVATRFTIASGGDVYIPSGNVSIGNTSVYPSGSNTILQIYSVSVPRLKLQNSTTGTASTAGSSFYVTGDDLIINNGETSGVIQFEIGGGTPVMRMEYGGNIGIGTISPGRKLTVTGDVSGDANNLLLSNENDTDGDSASIGFSMLSNNTYVKSGIFFERTTTQGRGSLHLAVNNEVNGNNVTKTDAKLTINNSGNVGIGTTDPERRLTVGDGNGSEIISIYAGTTSASAIHFTDTNTSTDYQGFVSYNHNVDALRLGTAETERMRIESNGNLLLKGTGITSLLKFDSSSFGQIQATGNTLYYDIDTQVFRNSAGTSEHMRIDSLGRTSIIGVFESPTSEGILNLKQSSGVGSLGMGFYDGGTNPHFWLQSRSYSNYSTTYNLALQPTGGNVGIGTTSPGYKLDVYGTSGDTLTARFKAQGASTDAIVDIESERDCYLRFRPANTNKWTIVADYPATGDLDIYNYPNNFDSITFKDNRNIITNMSGGNFGIGTTAPRAKLEVNGELIAKDIKHSNFSVSSLSTTGYTIATVTGGGNGQSAQIEFVGMGGTSGIVDVVYSCTNQGGNWYAYKKARQTPTIVDVDVTGHGTTTLSFIFKSLSGTAGYTPRLMMKGSPSALVTF